MHEAFRAFDKLSRRIRHGVKEELLDLVSIEGVGRIRARALYARGYRTREEGLGPSTPGATGRGRTRSS
ncbi:hypothetical protein B6U99_03345 [Candidatus Geothermarchaeota archaeon ex4572_27]|nr:MAG: hypothetical protein B6U99_03345 [Candidatus Geothermarchaeota archaeon ex4572_27]